MFGGAVINPAETLAQMLAACRDERGRVTIPGFYDDVAEVPADERKDWAKLPFDNDAYVSELEVDALLDTGGFSILESLWARPTFDVNGLLSGFTGEGSKTVLPATAMAKVSMRLVADQDPDKIADAFEAYMREIVPPGVTIRITRMHGGKPWSAPREHPILQAAARALQPRVRSRDRVRAGGRVDSPDLDTRGALSGAHRHDGTRAAGRERTWSR